jgi:sporulation protein YlmC with PRC-barrel domain
MIKMFGSSALLVALLTTVAVAQQTQPLPPATSTRPAPQVQPAPRTDVPTAQVMTSLPGDASTINHWYKQSVYDPSDSKIGEIEDVLVDKQGKIIALIVGAGGFLGMGEKYVAVPQNAVHATTKNNNKWYLVMNTTKDALKSAPGYKYDRTAMVWMPENAPATTGERPVAR